MHLSVRSIVLLAAGTLAIAACSESTTAPPPRATSLSVVAGDGDSGEAGEQIQLQVRVLGPNGSGLPGVEVAWDVTNGPSSIEVQRSTSDANGIAANTVTLGGIGAPTTIEASTGTIPSVTFTVGTIDPCTILHLLAFGSTIGAALGATDCRLSDNTLIDFFLFTQPQLSGTSISMSSGAFNTYVFLFDSAGNPVAFDDDISATNTNSQLRAILPAADYIVGANVFPASAGDYNLGVQSAGLELAACEVAWTVKGVAVSQQLDAATCPAPDGTPLFADHLLLLLFQGQSLTVTMTAASFPARIVLYNGSGFIQTSASATGAGQLVTVTFTAPGDDVYVVQLGAVGGATGGAYQLSIQ